MKKQELLHLHGLLEGIARDCRDEGVPVDLAGYHDLGTRPTAVQAAKADHRRPS